MTELEQLQKDKKVLLDRIASLEQELEKEKEYKQKVFDVINKDHNLMGILLVSLNIQNFLAENKGRDKCTTSHADKLIEEHRRENKSYRKPRNPTESKEVCNG